MLGSTREVGALGVLISIVFRFQAFGFVTILGARMICITMCYKTIQ